jgi:hypothetical protein
MVFSLPGSEGWASISPQKGLINDVLRSMMLTLMSTD